MEPTLLDSDFVLVRKSSTASEGSVVLAQHPEVEGLRVVKRLKDASSQGFFLESDNSEGTDSHSWGYLPAIDGEVTLVLNRLGQSV